MSSNERLTKFIEICKNKYDVELERQAAFDIFFKVVKLVEFVYIIED
jgi:hypothetical protein